MKLINNKLAIAVSIAMSVSACTPDKTSQEHISAAKISIESSDSATAILELKNAVRVDLKNAEARMLLGTLYLDMGDAELGEKELKRALELNGDIENTLPKLLKALNLQSKSKESLSLIDKHDIFTPEILLYQAQAYIRLDQKDMAKLSIAQANDLSTESIYSQLGEAYLKADSSNVDGALENVDKILVTEPYLTEALILKGQLHIAKNEYVNAINAFEEYYRLLPRDVQIRLFLANAYVKNEQFEQADEHLDFLLKLAPEHPFTNQLKGLVYYQKADYLQALNHTQKAIQNGLGNASSRLVAGLSAFKLDQYELAHQYLATLSELPPTHPVQRVLALIQMQLGYNTKAGITLDELEGLTPHDVSLFTSASFELLKEGKIGEAKKTLNRADTIVGGGQQEMTKIGILKLSMNDLSGLASLEKAVEMDSKQPIVKIALAAAYLQANEYDKALNLAKKWKESHPDQVEGYNLAAKILLEQSEVKKAEQEMHYSLEINENNPFSRLYFANKFLVNEKPKEAILQLEKIFSKYPDHLAALKLNYRAHQALKMEKTASDKIAQSFNNNSSNLAYRLLHARALFIGGSYSKTIEVLEDVENTENVTALQWALLGDSYSKLSKNEKALLIFNDWIKAQPHYREAWLRKVSIQEKLADYNGALSTVEQVLAKAPDDGQFTVLRVNYLFLTDNFRDAQLQIDKLTNEQKELPLVKGLQGKIWLREGKHEKAIPNLEEFQRLLPTPFNTALLFATYKELEREKDAFSFMQKHIELHPEDIASRSLLAESAINYDPALAKKHYVQLLKLVPSSLSMLNNLAWVEYQLTNYTEAELVINKALKLNKGHPQILDTAGLIQVKLGNKIKAVELLNKAKLLAPGDEEIARHYKEAVTQ